MLINDRIARVMELLGIKLYQWGVYYPPPIDDIDTSVRISWDVIHED